MFFNFINFDFEKLKKKIAKKYRTCRYYIKAFFGILPENAPTSTATATENIKPKKKKKKNESPAAHKDHFARSFGYVDYNDFKKRYCRNALQQLISVKPVLLVGKLILNEETENKKFYTFTNIKPFCPGYEVKEICDHINIAKKIVHRWYNIPTVEKDNNVYFVFECRINQYESIITPKRPDFKIKRYGIDIVDEIKNVHPFFCARREDMANSIPQHVYVNFTESKLNRYVGRRLNASNNKKDPKIFQYNDLNN